MPAETPTKPVDSQIARVNDELEVGHDLDFQKRWWRFEKIVWIVFTVILALDVVGAFGRGVLAKGELRTKDGTVIVQYDRIERYSTPSTLTVEFTPAAIHNGLAQVWVADVLLKELGNQQVVPEPASSTLDHGGILYTFHAAPVADSVKFMLQPKQPGYYRMALRPAGLEQMSAGIFVMP